MFTLWLICQNKFCNELNDVKNQMIDFFLVLNAII